MTTAKEKKDMRVIQLIGYVAGVMGPHLKTPCDPDWKYLEEKFARAISEAEKEGSMQGSIHGLADLMDRMDLESSLTSQLEKLWPSEEDAMARFEGHPMPHRAGALAMYEWLRTYLEEKLK